MKHRIAILAGLLPLAMTAVGAAQAQPIYVTPRVYGAPPPMVAAMLPPYEVLAIVRASGFSPLTQPARRGLRYVVLASDRAGGQVRVVVNGVHGNIVRVTPAYDARFAYQPARPPVAVPGARMSDAVPPHELQSAPPARPSRDVAHAPAHAPAAHPGARMATAPQTTSAPPPRREVTPLPRPRPQMAANAVVTETSPEAEAAPPPAQAAAPVAQSEPSGAVVPTPRWGRGAARTKSAESPLVPVAPLD